MAFTLIKVADARLGDIVNVRTAQSEREIEMYRRYPDCYGYVFFVMRKRGN